MTFAQVPNLGLLLAVLGRVAHDGRERQLDIQKSTSFDKIQQYQTWFLHPALLNLQIALGLLRASVSWLVDQLFRAEKRSFTLFYHELDSRALAASKLPSTAFEHSAVRATSEWPRPA